MPTEREDARAEPAGCAAAEAVRARSVLPAATAPTEEREQLRRELGLRLRAQPQRRKYRKRR